MEDQLINKMLEDGSRRRRKRSMFDVSPDEMVDKKKIADVIQEVKAAAAQESSAVEAAMRVAHSLSEHAPKVTADRIRYALLDKDRERCERALERNLLIIEEKDADYYPSATKTSATKKKILHASTSRAGIGAKGAAKNVIVSSSDRRTSCYVSELPQSYCNQEHLKKLFSQYGKVNRIKIYLDPFDLPKGDALIIYAQATSVERAIKGLHSTVLEDKRILVEESTFRADTALTGSGAILGVPTPKSNCIQEDGLPALCESSRMPVVLLRHLYDPIQCKQSPNFLLELEAEIHQECIRYGSVVAVHAPKAYPGAVAVSFRTVKAGELCVCAMAGRWFDNVQISVERLGNWEDSDAATTLNVQDIPPLSALPNEFHTAALAILRNVYTAEELAAGGPTFIQGVEAEFQQECSKYGDLISVRAFPDLSALFGAVLLAFASEEARHNCSVDMDGRWFDFRRLRVQIYEPPPEVLLKEEDDPPSLVDKSPGLGLVEKELPMEHEDQGQMMASIPQEDKSLEAFFRDIQGVSEDTSPANENVAVG